MSMDEFGVITLKNEALGLIECSLSEFEEIARVSENKRLFDYFLSTMSFFADLCYERNNLALEIL